MGVTGRTRRRAGATRCLLLASGALLGIGALTGCQEPSSITTASSPVPIIYDPRLSPEPLTEEQLEEIINEARKVKPEGRDIWHILVHANKVYEGKPHWSATVYFTPDSATSRVRKGRSSYIRSDFRELNELLARVPDSRPAEGGRLDNYMQVSLASKPFHRTLETPTAQLWPFPEPSGFSDEEIIEIVDFARASPRPSTSDKPGTLSIPECYDGQEPIHEIKRSKEGVVEVRSGAQQDWLAGAGTVMECIKKEGHWVALRVYMWAS